MSLRRSGPNCVWACAEAFSLQSQEAERLAAEEFRPRYTLPVAAASTSDGAEEGTGEDGAAGGGDLSTGRGQGAQGLVSAAEEELLAAAVPSSPGKKKAVGPSRGARNQQQ